MARVVSEAIVWPRQDDAAGMARAALATKAGRSGVLEVLEYTDLSREYSKPRVRLLWRITHEGSEAGLTRTVTVVACYSVTFDWYEAVDGPNRVDCPTGARPVTPPLVPPGLTLGPKAGG